MCFLLRFAFLKKTIMEMLRFFSFLRFWGFGVFVRLGGFSDNWFSGVGGVNSAVVMREGGG